MNTWRGYYSRWCLFHLTRKKDWRKFDVLGRFAGFVLARLEDQPPYCLFGKFPFGYYFLFSYLIYAILNYNSAHQLATKLCHSYFYSGACLQLDDG